MLKYFKKCICCARTSNDCYAPPVPPTGSSHSWLPTSSSPVSKAESCCPCSLPPFHPWPRQMSAAAGPNWIPLLRWIGRQSPRVETTLHPTNCWKSDSPFPTKWTCSPPLGKDGRVSSHLLPPPPFPTGRWTDNSTPRR